MCTSGWPTSRDSSTGSQQNRRPSGSSASRGWRTPSKSVKTSRIEVAFRCSLGWRICTLALARPLRRASSWHPRACYPAALPNVWTQTHGLHHQVSEGNRVGQAVAQASRDCTQQLQSCHRVLVAIATALPVHGVSPVVRAGHARGQRRSGRRGILTLDMQVVPTCVEQAFGLGFRYSKSNGQYIAYWPLVNQSSCRPRSKCRSREP